MTYLDDTFEADLAYAEQMEQGSVWLRRSVLRAQGNVALADHLQCHDHFGPSDLIWRRPFQGKHREPGDPKFAETETIRLRLEERDRAADSRRVNREPCPYCGVRADIGCRHGWGQVGGNFSPIGRRHVITGLSPEECEAAYG